MHDMSFILADIYMKVEPVNLQKIILVRALFFIYDCIALGKMLYAGGIN